MVDNIAPGVASIERQDPTASPTNANSLTWRVTFSEEVANVDVADFEVSGTMATLTANAVAGSSLAYDVTVAGGDLAELNGTVTLSFAPDQDIVDAVGNALATTAPTGTNDNTWMVDNTVPTASNSTVGATEDTDYTFSAADFNFADENAGARLESVTIQTLPAPETGTLKLADSNVDAGASVTRAQIDNGTLTYSPSENGHGTAHASFSFRVSDGPHESADAYTMTIDVEPSNDLATGVPIVTAPNVFRVPATLSVDLSAIEDIEGVTRIAESAAYRWKRFDSGGTIVAPDIATGPTYTLAAADVGRRIGVEVTFNDDAGFEESITSAAFPTTGTIRSAAGACPAPTHVGGATQIWSANLGVAEFKPRGKFQEIRIHQQIASGRHSAV